MLGNRISFSSTWSQAAKLSHDQHRFRAAKASQGASGHLTRSEPPSWPSVWSKEDLEQILR